MSERRLSSSLERMAESLARAYDGAEPERRDVAGAILERVGRRTYAGVGEFGAYLAALGDGVWGEYWGEVLVLVPLH